VTILLVITNRLGDRPILRTVYFHIWRNFALVISIKRMQKVKYV